MEVVEGGFGELAVGEVQGLERFDFGEVLQAGVGDRGGVEVQSFQRGEVGEHLQHVRSVKIRNGLQAKQTLGLHSARTIRICQELEPCPKLLPRFLPN